MKLKRRFMMLVLTATMLFSTVVFAREHEELHLFHTGEGLALTALVDFESGGNWFIRDDYYYNVALHGNNASLHISSKDSVCLEVRDDEGDTAVTARPRADKRWIGGCKTYGRSSDYAEFGLIIYDKNSWAKAY